MRKLRLGSLQGGIEEGAARQKKARRREVAQESEKARSMRVRGRRNIGENSEGGIGGIDEVGGEFVDVDLGNEGL